MWFRNFNIFFMHFDKLAGHGRSKPRYAVPAGLQNFSLDGYPAFRFTARWANGSSVLATRRAQTRRPA
jgi:hypothetical protein